MWNNAWRLSFRKKNAAKTYGHWRTYIRIEIIQILLFLSELDYLIYLSILGI